MPKVLALLKTLFVILFDADASLESPKPYQVTSPSKKYIAVLDPEKGVSVKKSNDSKILWVNPQLWSRQVFLNDDGEYLVSGYDGLNLIPVNYSKDLALITFWHKDKKIRELTVGDLFPKNRGLIRTASHYHWGSIKGIKDNILSVKLANERELSFDIRTGEKK